MTDYPEQPGFLEAQPHLDDLMLYDGVDCPNMEMPSMPVSSPKHFAFSSQDALPEHVETIQTTDEGLHAHYIPYTSEHGMNFMHAAAEQHFVEYQNPYMLDSSQHVPMQSFSHRVPPSSQPSPSTMTEFFQLMSQPENVQAYMQFLQNQHDSAPQQTSSPAPTRSRSNSQPATSNLSANTTSRSSWPESTSDNTSSRERKIAKYRTKRARRLTGSAQVPADSCPLSVSAPPNDMTDIQQYMPAPKMQKTLTRDLENRLISSEEEVRLLQNALASREVELQLLRQAFDDQQRQIAMSIYGDASSNPSSSACTSPRPRSPSTPAMVSSPSSVSIGSSTMDTEYGGSLDTSSMGSSEHMMEVLAAQRRQEKLKKLGGPPSDVYHPWWHGISLNHPAFQEKEDWANVELRPHQDLLARERLNYLLNMQRFKMEQSRLAMEQQQQHMPVPSTGAPPHMSHPYTHQPPVFYQSPHQSHIQTGSPVHAGGFWSGHFAPNTPEKIDFSKISLRKTSSEAPPPQQSSVSFGAIPRSLSHSAGSSPSVSQSTTSPVSPHQPTHHSMQASPTAAIWREAMAHPEIHGFPEHLSWIREQPELQHRMQLHPQSHRVPFRRQAPTPTSSTFTNRMSPHGPSVSSPRATASSTAMDC